MNIRFLKLDYTLITDRNIDSNQFRVYTYLLSLYNKDKKCSYPALSTISIELSIGITTVKKAIKHLRDLGYLAIEKQKCKLGNHNKYKPKHIILNKTTASVNDKVDEIKSEEEVKRHKVEQHNNIRFLRKYVEIDSNEAIRDMCTSLSYENVVEGYKLFKSKVEGKKWQVNCSSNLFRDIIQVYYNKGQRIPSKAFNFYRKYMDNVAMQPK
ncbi:MAG: helix-turn-helix domain-containing protein [Clostridium sp.]|uniref:helix-turn-helix domain-containing protein n=1 Tax=Clostridium sp. TaxID=1506 RepID=UPI003F2D446D